MRTAGIISEYNPFHRGHAWQIGELRRRLGAETAVICAMSGSFVQRGDFAVMRTHARAEAAVRGGADLVLELPLPWAIASAEGFAAGGVGVLAATGAVDTLVFGSECGDTETLKAVAAALESESFAAYLRQGLQEGVSFAAAREAAARKLLGEKAAVLAQPNDILGVEYCKALLRQHSALVPLALPRRGAAHDAPLDAAPGRYASASALRALVRAGGAAALAPHVPPACLRLYMQAEAEGDILDGRAFGIAVLSRLRAMDAAGLRAVRGAAEGLENRLAAAVQGAGTLDELVQAMRTKRYATARLRRLVLDAALGYTGDLPALPPYLHVLGANETGLAVLRCARQAALLPLSHSLADLAARSAPAARVAAAHAAAEDLTALCLRHPAPMGAAYTAKPVFPTSGAK